MRIPSGVVSSALAGAVAGLVAGLCAPKANAQSLVAAPTPEVAAATSPADPTPNARPDQAPDAAIPEAAPQSEPEASAPEATPRPAPQRYSIFKRRIRPTPHRPHKNRPKPPASGAVDSPFVVALNQDLTWFSRKSFDLYSENDLAQRGGLSVGYDVLTLSPIFELGLELGYGYYSNEDSNKTGVLFGGTVESAELTEHTPYAAVSLRYDRWHWFEPHARLGLAAAFVHTELKAPQNPKYSRDATLPATTLGAGFTLRTPDRTFQNSKGDFAALSFGLLAEGGYQLASPLELPLDPEESDPRIPIRNANLGDVTRSGPYLRVAFLVRF